MRSPIKLVTVLGCWEVGLHDATRELLDACKINVNLERLVHGIIVRFRLAKVAAQSYLDRKSVV